MKREIENIESHLSAHGFSLNGKKPTGQLVTVWREGKRLERKLRKAANVAANKPKVTSKRQQRKTKKKQGYAESFYTSEGWRRVRYQALELADGGCVLCGRTRKHGVVLHVDHIKPRSLYPHLSLVLTNLQVLCDDCNLGKSNKSERDWR